MLSAEPPQTSHFPPAQPDTYRCRGGLVRQGAQSQKHSLSARRRADVCREARRPSCCGAVTQLNNHSRNVGPSYELLPFLHDRVVRKRSRRHSEDQTNLLIALSASFPPLSRSFFFPLVTFACLPEVIS